MRKIGHSGFAQDGYSRADGYATRPLNEGFVQKGGKNPQSSQLQNRPADPAPMRPAPGQGSGTNGEQGNQSKQSSTKKRD